MTKKRRYDPSSFNHSSFLRASSFGFRALPRLFRIFLARRSIAKAATFDIQIFTMFVSIFEIQISNFSTWGLLFSPSRVEFGTMPDS